jgi:hypothetical protein
MADIFLGTEVEPSAFEIALQQLFLGGLNRTIAETGDFTSSVESALGFKRDADGNLVKLTEQERFDNLSPVEQRNFNLLKSQVDRLEKAFAGDLPVSERLKQRSMDQFDVLKEEQARRGNVVSGTDLDTAVGFSTPAIQSIGERQRTQGLLEGEEQKNEISQGFANVFNTSGLLRDYSTQNIANLVNAPSRHNIFSSGGLLANAGAASRINAAQENEQITDFLSLGAGLLGKLIP